MQIANFRRDYKIFDGSYVEALPFIVHARAFKILGVITIPSRLIKALDEKHLRFLLHHESRHMEQSYHMILFEPMACEIDAEKHAFEQMRKEGCNEEELLQISFDLFLVQKFGLTLKDYREAMA